MSQALSTQPIEAPSWRTWFLAIRPRTLTAAISPVLVGTALAAREGKVNALAAIAALVGALFIQIGTNLTNDYYDFKRGADTDERVGPTRVTQKGLATPGRVLSAALLSFALSGVVGIYLLAVGGWPIAVIGLFSVLSGYAYTGGPFPLGYHGLGDVFVFIFFGIVAVSGTYLVQAGLPPPHVLWASVPVASLATAILVVNNLRDIPTDAKAGKRTLAVRWGPTFARVEYVTLLVAAFVTPLVLAITGQVGWSVAATVLAFPFALAPLRGVFSAQGGALNQTLGQTAKLQLIFGALFAVGLWRS